MMIHKIISSVDYTYWLKHLDQPKFSEFTQQKIVETLDT